jgi:hypothetical protein
MSKESADHRGNEFKLAEVMKGRAENKDGVCVSENWMGLCCIAIQGYEARGLQGPRDSDL